MTEQLISWETAKLAKEKGFNIPCRGFIEPKYNDTLEFIDDTCLYVYDGFKPLKEHHEVLDENWYLAPTQSLLQKWLREVHNIFVGVIWLDTLTDIHVYQISTVGNATRPYSKFYNSYEEALEEGLLEALKLT